MESNSMDIWQNAAEVIVKAGMVPIVISDTMIELLQMIMTEEQARFIKVFDNPSLNLDQILERTQMDKTTLKTMLFVQPFGEVITKV